MIAEADHPVQWALMLAELDEVADHIAELRSGLSEDGAISEPDFRIELGHIYAHLNRIWHSRFGDLNGDDAENWAKASRFPEDLDPVG
ncbi:hypothetical protein [Nitrogeniibacter aestuarii]|uniref:hypothetical protein n=1 Tax=Nitrogeniibacter aestuarii TaxID=2815343 RepID=UPI001D103E3F|nr:hypothetical protein [Nitrogeniibacter aestuarii]